MDTVHPFTKIILSASEDLVIALDETGKILNTNNAWKKIKHTNEYTQLVTEKSSFLDLLESTHNNEQLNSIQQVLRGEIDEFQKEFTSPIEKNRYCYSFRTYRLKLPSNQLGAIVIYSVNTIEKDLSNFAYYDFLTNLPNRRMTYDILQHKIKKQEPFSLFYVELDGFKLVKDMYGHARGDTLLVDIAKFLNEAIELEKVVARVGGDEFVIIIDEVNKEQLSRITNKMIQDFQQISESLSVPSIPLCLSIGISRYPEDAPDTELLFHYANIAMNSAKKRKANNFNFFEHSMVEKLERKVHIENELHGDLKETTIHFVGQPQFNSKTNEVIGIEVLTRWIHPKYGYIAPPEFIGIADNSGRIAELTKYLISKVFSNVSRWIEDYGFDKPVAINITPRLLGNRQFFNDLIHFIQYYRIPPQMVDIEITENANLDTDQNILDNIAFCRKHGIRLSLDDFGTGYSKLADLVDFQIDKLKIDKYFVDKIGKETNAELILHTFMNLAKGLKCDVLAEGVETKEQVDYLNTLGLNYFQGYYFSKPIPLEEFEQNYLQNRKL